MLDKTDLCFSGHHDEADRYIANGDSGKDLCGERESQTDTQVNIELMVLTNSSEERLTSQVG